MVWGCHNFHIHLKNDAFIIPSYNLKFVEKVEKCKKPLASMIGTTESFLKKNGADILPLIKPQIAALIVGFNLAFETWKKT